MSKGRKEWVGQLAVELREKTCEPGAVRRVNMPKPNGKTRPLGIPNVKDRVVQTAAGLILGSIFEADLQDEQFAYREGRQAGEAVRSIQKTLNCEGRKEAVDGDLGGYFDSIPHAELMKSVARRVSDKSMLHLVKMWLEAPVEEKDEKTGTIKRTTVGKDTKRGTPQGSPISPLLSNVYMRRFMLGWKQRGYDRRFGAKIINYADDFVICCKRNGAEALEAMRGIMEGLKLTVNEEKTKLCIVPEDRFIFLGHEFGWLYSFKKQKRYIGVRPARKATTRIKQEIHDQTAANNGWMEVNDMVKALNSKLNGWANYFSNGAVSKAYKEVGRHATSRLRQWLRRKHKVKSKGYTQYPDEKLYKEYGLVNLQGKLLDFPWAKA
jgi:group II intron reverse transcriptase/maturase